MGLREARRLGTVVLLLGIAILGIVVALRLYSTLFLGAAAVAGPLAFLVYTHRGAAGSFRALRASWHVSPRMVPRLRSLSTMFFFLLTAGSLLVAVRDPYTKPELYYILAAASAAALAARVLLLSVPQEVPFTLAMVAVLALNLFGSNQLAFPLGIGGADARAHIDALVAPIAATGNVPIGACGGSALIYFFFPASQVYVASSAVLMSASPVNTFYAMGFLGMASSVVILFTIVRPLIGTRRAFLAAVFLAGSSYYLFWASHASATTFAIPLIATFVLVLRELHKQRNRQMIVAAAILSVALVLTHPYSSVIFVIVLLGMIAGELYARRSKDAWIWGLVASAVIFAGWLVVDWVNFSCLTPTALRFFREYLSTIFGSHLVSSGGSYDALPLGLLFLNTFADSLLLALSVLGFLLLYARGLSRARMLIIGPGVALLFVTMLGLLTNLVYLLPARVYAYLQLVALAPLAAVGIAALYRGTGTSHGAETNPVRILLVVGIVALFVFGSTASTIAGFETSPLDGGRPFVKVYNTQYEAASANWLCQRLAHPPYLVVSRSVAGLPSDQVNRCTKSMGTEFENLPVTSEGAINMTLLKPGAYVWFSWFDVSTIFQYKLLQVGRYGGAAYTQLTPTAAESFQSFDRIYDNGQIQVFWNEA